MNSASALPSWAEADAARRGFIGPAKARGNPIPARADQVAAQSPGGGEPRFCVVAKLPANPSQAVLELREVARTAAAYPPEAAGVPAWERARYFTPIQRAAWEQRFGTGQP